VTTSIGILQLPPVVISTRLKIMLFVMVDGWNLLVGSLMKSFPEEAGMGIGARDRDEWRHIAVKRRSGWELLC